MRYIILAIIFNTSVNLIFKYSSILESAGNKKSTLIYLVGLIMGVVGSLFYTKSLRTINLNIAYSFFAGGTSFLILIISFFLNNIKVTWGNILGTVFIVIGIYFSSKR